MPECVRCKDCAFLSVRNASTSDVYPADERVREYGTPRTRLHYAPEGFGVGGFPMPETDNLICFYGVPAFAEDMESEKTAKKAIEKEKACPQFRTWIPGKTPKEHEEMTIIEQVRAESDRFRAEERQWQQQVEALAETRHQELRRDNRTMAIWALMIALVSAIIGGLISRQWGG